MWIRSVLGYLLLLRLGAQGFFPVWVDQGWEAESQSSHFDRVQVKQLALITILMIEWGRKLSEMWIFGYWIERE